MSNGGWISGNFFLNQSQMENNATIMARFFTLRGWTKNAIAGMLGNMQTESSLNPGIWENLEPYAGGYGLVQWTPYTKYSNWAGDGWEDNGEKEMERIIYELENGLQWISTSKYPMTFEEFSVSTASPEELAQAWLYNYERPADLDQPQRSTQARAWFEFIGGISTIPIWLMFKMARGY